MKIATLTQGGLEEAENSSDSKNGLDPVEVDDHVAEGVGELIL